MLMAAARLDLPSVFVYNGSILPGNYNGKSLDITSVFEADRGLRHRGHQRRGAVRDRAAGLSHRGRCAGMFTANTMASIAEALGMSLPGSASPPAVDRRREDDAREAAGPSCTCSTWASRRARS